LDIAANETTTARTNLTSQSYTGAMRTARQFMDAADYDRAAEALGDALRAQPNDPGATSLQREAIGLGSIRRAEALGKEGDYITGINVLNTALKALPENERAKLMFADFKQHEPEQIERNRLERLHRGEKIFDAVLVNHRDADLFDRYELKTSKPVKEVETAIVNALRIPPAMTVIKDVSTVPETFVIEAAQEFSTILATSAGRRVCLIVGARTRNDETQILFKILEYKTEAAIKYSIGNLIGAPVSVNYVAIHPSRMGTVSEKLQARLNEGKTNVMARIQGAIGQTPTPSSP
jgi:tetratricopeptide (TPR) repeat protein